MDWIGIKHLLDNNLIPTLNGLALIYLVYRFHHGWRIRTTNGKDKGHAS